MTTRPHGSSPAEATEPAPAGPLVRQKTIVTRERVVAPPDRFIDVTDGELIAHFQGAFPAADAECVPQLHELIEGLCAHSFSRLRRALEQDFAYFAHAAAAEAKSDPRERDPASAASELDAQEERFLSHFMELLEAGHYKLLSATEWDATCAEDFLLTLPVGVNWAAVDASLLQRALWRTRPAQRADYPPALADHILIFHRGVDVARMRGTYYMQKVDLLLSFYLLQPLYRLCAAAMASLGVHRFVFDAPAYVAPADDAVEATTGDGARAAADAAARAIRVGAAHPASINVERRTFARVFPDGPAVLGKLLQRVELREACFKDVVVLYRRAVPDARSAPEEMEVVKEADPAFLQRNIVVKRFASIPLADLELVFPDTKIYMPPQVVVNMAVSIIGALVALFTLLRGGFKLGVALPVVSMLGTRGFAVYTAFHMQVTSIGRAMQRLLYERTVASQQAVLSTLTEEMASQRTREVLVAYCVLATSARPLTPAQLDARCEALLSSQFGLRLDFTGEDALAQLARWGLAVPADGTADGAAAVRALPLREALPALDAVWDSLYDFTAPEEAATGGAPSSFLSGMLSTRSRRSRPRAAAPAPGASAKHPASPAATAAAKAPASPMTTTAAAAKTAEPAMAGPVVRTAEVGQSSAAAAAGSSGGAPKAAAAPAASPEAAVARQPAPPRVEKKKPKGLFGRLKKALSP